MKAVTEQYRPIKPAGARLIGHNGDKKPTGEFQPGAVEYGCTRETDYFKEKCSNQVINNEPVPEDHESTC